MATPNLRFRATTLCLLMGGASFSYGGTINDARCEGGRFTLVASPQNGESCTLNTLLFVNGARGAVLSFIVDRNNSTVPLRVLRPTDQATVQADLICNSAARGTQTEDNRELSTDNGCSASDNPNRPVAVDVSCLDGEFAVTSQPQGNGGCRTEFDLTVNGQDIPQQPAQLNANEQVTRNAFPLPTNAVASMVARLTCDNGLEDENNQDTVTGCRGSAQEQVDEFNGRRERRNAQNNENLLTLDCSNGRVRTTVTPPTGQTCNLTRRATVGGDVVDDIGDISDIDAPLNNDSPFNATDDLEFQARVECGDAVDEDEVNSPNGCGSTTNAAPQPQPQPRNDQPQPRNDQQPPQPRNDQQPPQPRNDQQPPQPRNDQQPPQPRNDQQEQNNPQGNIENLLTLDCSNGRVRTTVTPPNGQTCDLTRTASVGGQVVASIGNISDIDAPLSNDSPFNATDNLQFRARVECGNTVDEDNVSSTNGCGSTTNAAAPQDDEQAEPRNDQRPENNDQRPENNDQPQPRNDQPQPRNDQQQPRNDQPQPRNDQPQPRNDQPQPRNDQQQPRNDQQQPRNDQQQPRNDQPQPRNDQQQPRNDQQPPQPRNDQQPPQPRNDQQPPQPRNDQQPPQPRNDQEPQPRNDEESVARSQSRSRNGQQQPQNDQEPPQPRNDQQPPQPRNDQQPPQPRNDQEPPQPRNDQPQNTQQSDQNRAQIQDQENQAAIDEQTTQAANDLQRQTQANELQVQNQTNQAEIDGANTETEARDEVQAREQANQNQQNPQNPQNPQNQ